MPKNQLNFEELFNIIEKKINSPEVNSYISRLSQGGEAYIAQKVGEEAVEVVIASLLLAKKSTALDNSNNQLSLQLRQDLINEICDLYFHTMILMAQHQVCFADIFQEFYQRNQLKK